MNTGKILDEIAQSRVLILDGAMGTMIQSFKLAEDDFRGGRFASRGGGLPGCNDVLCLTRPDVIDSIHRSYLEAGADIIETCSFNATSVSLEEYGFADMAYEISAAAARIARQAADAFSSPDKPRFVAGSMGPTSKSAGIAPDMNDLSKRSVTFDELAAAYYDNARGLLDGGADILLVETVFDAINAKAAVFAVDRIRDERQVPVPLMISATIANDAGHILSGQSLTGFFASVLHGNPWAIGLNCSFGADRLEPHVRKLAGLAPCRIIAYPNAGLPNRRGEYDETPETMAARLEGYLRGGLVNILGGCCGSTPAHIAAIAEKARGFPPRKASAAVFAAGLWRGAAPGTLTLIGERTNVTKNRDFLRLVEEEDYDEAVSLAQNMLEDGAAAIDLCLDGVMPDEKKAITRFLNLGFCYPGFAQALVMIESSDWEAVEAALKCLPGKGLACYLSLKDGEAEFLRRARQARRYGAAVAVTLYDGQGRTDSYERKTAAAERSYALLTGAGFPPEDIVFDPVALPLSAGISGRNYAACFIRACAWIREKYPGVNILGNITNLSEDSPAGKAFMEALQAVFLKRSSEAGLTMAVVNPAAMVSWDSLEDGLRQAAEAALFGGAPG